jgi:pimeloyl-ACP methyl ester carboxylesterase
VIVAFGGTAAASLEDWKSNLRWFLAPFNPHDAYEVLTDVYVPEFIEEYRRKSNEPGGEWLKTAQVVATGHSLGGGLAQRFAYSLQRDRGIPPVREVYAFDPSPVSGKRSVPDFEKQAGGLTIYRIYNRGEVLASVRSLLQLSNKDNSRNQGQTWVDIRYKNNWTWRTLLPSGSVHAHGMYDLACFMKQQITRSARSAIAQA